MSEVKLEDRNSLKESQDRNGHDQQSSTSKPLTSSTTENGQPTSNVQKSKDRTDKEITNLSSIVLTDKESSTTSKLLHLGEECYCCFVDFVHSHIVLFSKCVMHVCVWIKPNLFLIARLIVVTTFLISEIFSIVCLRCVHPVCVLISVW